MGTVPIWYFKEFQADDQDLGSRHVSKDGPSIHLDFISPVVRWGCGAKTQRQLPAVLTLPPSFFCFGLLELPSFLHCQLFFYPSICLL